jgi:hypothetical protein
MPLPPFSQPPDADDLSDFPPILGWRDLPIPDEIPIIQATSVLLSEKAQSQTCSRSMRRYDKEM